jgi:metal-responsive CopG/Arc/MetJ family transcriptional regulator
MKKIMKKLEQDTELLGVGVSVRLPPTSLEQIDRLANEERRSRANLIMILIEDALKARSKGKK